MGAEAMKNCSCEEWGPTGYACIGLKDSSCKLRQKSGKFKMAKRGYRFKVNEGCEYTVWDKPVGWEADIYKEQTKMTREEAVRQLQNKAIMSRTFADQLLDALEALGLLKFDEAPEPDCRELLINSSANGPVCVKVFKAIEALEKAGYKVDKRS